jgi:SprB repeat/Disaggregatase related repeat/Secretion system C-terminal sorting domain
MKKMITMKNLYTALHSQCQFIGQAGKCYKLLLPIIAFLIGSQTLVSAQTVTLTANKDANIWNNNAGDELKNYGNCDKLYINGPSGTAKDRQLINFDLSSIPANAIISSATFRLVKTAGSNTSLNVSVHRLTADWTEGTGACGGSAGVANWQQRMTSTAWTTPGGDFNATAEATVAVAGNDTYNWTVTSLVQNWVNGTNGKYGLIAKYTTENTNAEKEFASSENGTAANRPQLIVTYTLPTATLASNTVASATLCPVTAKVPIQSFSIAQTGGDANFTGLNFTTTGTYVAGDLSNFKLWTNTTNSLGSATQISSTLSPAGPGTQTFAAFTQTLTTGQTRYFWITMDVATPTSQKTLAVNAITTTDITTSGAKAGSTTAGGTQTINAVSGSISPQTNVLCYGQSTGAFTVTGSGGTAPYTYSFNGGAYSATATFTSLAAGAYTVTVRDANNCTSSTINVTIAQPASAVSGSISTQTNVNCFGGTTGAVTVTGSGGVAPYTYRIGAGSYGVPGAGTFSGLTAGSYTVTVRDANLCTTTVAVTITGPASALSYTLVSKTDLSCFANGNINVTISGGTSPYTYVWTKTGGGFSAGTQDIIGIAAGTYQLTATDAKGCTVSSGDIVIAPASGCTGTTVCKTDTNSVFSTPPDPEITSYLWTLETVPPGTFYNGVITGGTTSTISINWTTIPVGSYNVCVVANNICGTSTNMCSLVYVTAPAATASYNAACEGSDLQLFASGGVSYAWTGPNGFTSTSASPVVLNATQATNGGTYNLTVTDQNGCIATTSVNVVINGIPTLSGAIVNTNCGQSNGSITLTSTATSYLWSNGATTQNLTNLGSGNYSVTATNASGCSVTGTFAINNANGPVVVATPSTISCFGGTASISAVSASGGTSPYTYAWTGPGSFTATTANISSLVAGTYNLTVTDNTGCQGFYATTITQPDAITLDNTKVDVACFGATTGSINLNVSGGTTPYTYTWTASSGGVVPVGQAGNQDLTALVAGTYTVVVGGVSPCTASLVVVISQPVADLSASTTNTAVSCFGGANGTVNLSVSGGTSPYTFAWTRTVGGFTATTEDLSGLTVGTYSVVITDARGCNTTINNVIITQPTQIVIAAPVVTAVNCFGSATGSISVSASGGTGAYTYQWSNGGSSTNSRTGLTAGTYSVIVRDANGCSVNSGNIVVGQPAAALTVSTTPTAVTCFGGSNGAVSTSVSGGTTNYTYLWSNGATTANLSNVAAGSYQVTVTDTRGCTAISTATVNSPVKIELSGVVTNVLCNGASTGAITLSVSGGTGPFTYNWGGGITSQNRTSLAAGTYTVTVTGAGGCTATNTFTITQNIAITATLVNSNISCSGGSDGSINLSVSGGTGPYTYLWSNGATTEDISGLSAGVYSVTVRDANNCTNLFTSTTIQQPVVLGLSIVVNKNVTCFNGSDGGATATPTGGTATYTYQWSDGGTGAVRNNLSAGLYTVTVTDSKGCKANASVTITQPLTKIELFSTTKNTRNCAGTPSGSIDLTIVNGTAPFSYSWVGPTAIGNIQDPTALSAGTYQVTVTDSKGCSSAITVTIGTAPALLVSSTGISPTCVQTGLGSVSPGSNGQAYAIVTGGSGSYTYAWTGGATTSFINGLVFGTYNVTVTDVDGCTANTSVTLTQPTCTLPTAVDDEYTACSGTAVSGNVATNDTGGLTFLPLSGPTNVQGSIVWDETYNGAFVFTPTPGYNGTVTIRYRVENSSELYDEGLLTIYVSQMTASVTATPTNCTSGTASATVTHTGGFAPYTYLWNDTAAQTTATATGLVPENYSVTITDSKNCTRTATVTIEAAPPVPAAPTATVTNPTCTVATGTITVTAPATGAGITYTVTGTSPVVAAVSNSTGIFTGLAAGTYNVTTTNAVGCTSLPTARTIAAQPATPTANIGVDQLICYDGTANFTIALTGKAPWIVTYSNGTTSTTVTTNANPYTFSVNNITANATYTVTNLNDANCSVALPEGLTGSATVTVLTGTRGVWTGLISTDWFDCKNWEQGLPSSTIDAQIPSVPNNNGTPKRMPVIDRTSPFAHLYNFIATARDLIINSGASVTMVSTNNSELQISRDWRNSSIFNPGTGTVTFNGYTSNQIQTVNLGIKTNETFYNLTTNNSNGAKGISLVDAFELTVLNFVTLTSGDIRLTGEAQLVQAGTTANPSTGTGKLLKDQQGKKNSFNYNYWSSPVSTGSNNPYIINAVLRDGTDVTTNPFSPTAINFGTTFDFADTLNVGPIKITDRWIWSYNSPIVSGDDNVGNVDDEWANYYKWHHITSNGALNVGEGFTMKGTGGPADIKETQNYTFIGKPNSGTIILTLDQNNSYLVGNPYPSALDADEFIKDNIAETINSKVGRNTENRISGALYFWDHFGISGNHYLAEYQGGYATYSLAGGVVAINDSPLNVNDKKPGSNIPKQFIPVGQGFFIDGYLEPALGEDSGAVVGGPIVFKNSQRAFARESIPSSVFMKKRGTTKTVTDKRYKIRLGYISSIGAHRQLLVTADNNTTNQFDIGYDAPMYDTNDNDIFWKISNSQFVIQAVPDFNTSQVLPLGIVVANEGEVTIKIDTLENVPSSTKIYLHDNVTGNYHDIRNNDFKIALPIGEYSNRFSLKFESQTLSVGENDANDTNDGILVFYLKNDKTLIIKNDNLDSTVNSVSLFNILGQSLEKWDVKDKEQTNIQIPIKNLSSGIYVTKVKTSNGDFSKKIIIP